MLQPQHFLTAAAAWRTIRRLPPLLGKHRPVWEFVCTQTVPLPTAGWGKGKMQQTKGVFLEVKRRVCVQQSSQEERQDKYSHIPF